MAVVCIELATIHELHHCVGAFEGLPSLLRDQSESVRVGFCRFGSVGAVPLVTGGELDERRSGVRGAVGSTAFGVI